MVFIDKMTFQLILIDVFYKEDPREVTWHGVGEAADG